MKQQGFTLLELSIVLLVIGLLASGIIVGRFMIQQSEMRAIIGEVANYRNAMKLFQERYNCFPGDCPIASTVVPGCNSACDGNGDRYIDYNNAVGSGTETYRVWTHMSRAGFIPGTYSPTYAAENLIGTNVPQSRLFAGRAGYQVFALSRATDGWAGGDTEVENYIRFGGLFTTSGTIRIGIPMLTGQTTAEMDAKMDDGMPQSGRVWIHTNITDYMYCANGNSVVTSTYYKRDDKPGCLVHFSLKDEL